ncbi:phage gp6-like head-tail connector protein [Clostridium botulinum]|uniref:DNA packaging protein n=1 Tax=Clostridium botulinum (strain Eklund 17B / Type B) TaxID=935198 RepID=B2THE3_CLOBB|nr:MULTISPECIES: head-tail connector protein [Clostridium]ACD24262.1 putative DNA packaging protein [Clostridium botulinum B str. Eklund 17B (NRP)]MBY6977422.1 phage gp6-like head-tail connector protein [Clostridium botulinum]MBY7001977.1 phage gp6-like head-tail connector protein [Clostridium botulinum]MCR1275576.1 head-tail connector protein [Clostridium botulinum]MCS6131413.1 phage gp6-like head-tail connector protein [Clostridium botulinum]
MIITLEEAKNLLRVDFEEDNGLIQTLINTIPQYLENKTGRPWDTDVINPLVKTLAGFLLKSWYDGSTPQLEKTIENIIATLTPMAR